MQFVEVDSESSGQRVDNYLFRILKGVPRSHIYKLLRRGEVRLNGGRIKAHRKLVEGDRLRLPPIRISAADESGRPSDGFLKIIEKSIIYEDNRILILNKPAGIAVHGGSGVSVGVIEGLRALRPTEKMLELVHRLDRETSGCLMIARRRSALRTLQQALREKTGLVKQYQVIVHGAWPRRKKQVEAPLRKNTLKSGERISRVAKDGKPSLTTFEWQAGSDDYSILRASPITGRTHQIRVHCAISGCPVVGDPKYGNASADEKARGQGFTRMMLHAGRLVIPSLAPGEEPIEIEAEADQQFQDMVNAILIKQ
ncbi:MAG: RluA family pseudouridine synthase [Pseudomonadales bacterium]